MSEIYKTGTVWFCGTGETREDIGHLFDELLTGPAIIKNSFLRIVPGWGTGGYMSGERSFDWKAQLSGISENDTTKATEKDSPYSEALNQVINITTKLPDGEKIDKLVVGGFSRGSAFFLPLFLKNLCEHNTSPLQNINKLAIILIDPVTGSSHSGNKEDVTESTLSSLGILNKMQLLCDLASRVKDKIYIFSLIPGFDKRKQNFRPDTSFLSALAALKATGDGYNGIPSGTNNKIVSYTYRAGITHSVFSTYSKDKEKNPPITLNMAGGSLSFGQEDVLGLKLHELVKSDLDLMLTKNLISSLCLKTDFCYDQYKDRLDGLQNATTLILACAKQIKYDLGKKYWTGANNDNYVATEMRKLIQPSNGIDSLIDLLDEWHQ